MSNWEHKKMTEEEIKKLVRDVYDQKALTSLQLNKNDIRTVFLTLMFLGMPPNEPSLSEDNQVNRRNKLRYINECLEYEEETEEREEYLKNIGMVYEYMDQAGPRAINFKPSFFSMKVVSISDTEKFIEKYNKYVELRKAFEDEF